MKSGAGMVQDKRVDMGGMGDYNGVVGKNPGSRHQSHKDSAMDRSPYYDKVCTASARAALFRFSGWVGLGRGGVVGAAAAARVCGASSAALAICI